MTAAAWSVWDDVPARKRDGMGRGFWTFIAIVAAVVLLGMGMQSMVPAASAYGTDQLTSNTERLEGILGTAATALDETAAPEERAAAQSEAANILTDFSNWVNSMGAAADGALMEVAG